MTKERRQNTFFEMFHSPLKSSGPWANLKVRSRKKAEELGVEFMCISEGEGRLLSQLVGLFSESQGPQKWVEVGGLTGFSALCMLEGLPPEATLWTCEIDPERVMFLEALAQEPLLRGRLKVLAGDSKVSLQSLKSQGPFEGIFIDGAKSDYESNLDWCEQNLRSGGLILADNIFLNGEFFESDSKRSKAMQGFVARLKDSEKFRSCLVPSSDGLWLAKFIGRSPLQKEL